MHLASLRSRPLLRSTSTSAPPSKFRESIMSMNAFLVYSLHCETSNTRILFQEQRSVTYQIFHEDRIVISLHCYSRSSGRLRRAYTGADADRSATSTSSLIQIHAHTEGLTNSVGHFLEKAYRRGRAWTQGRFFDPPEDVPVEAKGQRGNPGTGRPSISYPELEENRAEV